MKVKQKTIWTGEDFEFTLEPVEDSISVEETPDGFNVRYLHRDDDAERPDAWGDDSLFLVGYNRSFWVDRGSYLREKKIIFKKEDFKKDNGYSGRVYADRYGWKSYEEAEKEGLLDKEITVRGSYVPGITQDLAREIALFDKDAYDSKNSEDKDKNNDEDDDEDGEYVSQSVLDYHEKYHIFGLEAYIHSGVVLAVSGEGNFCDRNWDVSNLGLVFASMEEFKTREDAYKAVKGLIETWNMYLSGDVYTCVVERYDKDKNPIDYDCCGGYYGEEHALEELKNFNG